jgi:aspartate carbamoyltransferase catalytic subunit
MSNKFVWTKKDLLGLEYLTAREIEHILDTAASFKEVSTPDIKKLPARRGKTAANLF